jgi:hypothetical protein
LHNVKNVIGELRGRAGSFTQFCQGQINKPDEPVVITTRLYTEMNSGCQADEGDICSTDCQHVSDPLVIDLSGNGLALTDVAHGVKFNLDGTGVRQTAWLAAGSRNGFLFIDRNQDGIVNDGSEMFLTAMTLSTGLFAENGFQALADLDVNHDSVIDAADPGFAAIKIWIDANGDGKTGPGEVMALGDAVDSIDLHPSLIGKKDSHGNLIYGNLSVRLKGQVQPVPAITDVWLAY